MTREEDLIRIAKKLDKMVSRNNTEGAVDLLKELKGFNMTLKLLQETRIGMSVNSIRKHCRDEDVVSLAKVLIKEWKRLLDSGNSHAEKSADMKNGLDSGKPAAAAANSSSSETQSRRDSDDGKTSKKLSDDAKRERKDSSDSKAPPSKKVTSEVKKEKHRKDPSDLKPCHAPKGHSTELKHIRRESTDSKRSSSPPAKKITAERRESLGSKPPGQPLRKSSTDSIERKGKIEAPRTPTTPTSPMSPSFNSPGGPLPPHLATGDSVRDKCIEMLAAALRTDNDYKDFGANCDSMAAEIEDHIYQEIRATDMKYKNRVRSRISNLKDPKNPGLRRNVLAGSIELSRMASMSAEEMASDELKQLRNVLTQEAIREHQMAKTGGTTTDLLQCGKCKKKNCTYNQVQTRSADEPMTTFVLCNECGNRWKFC
ncbi:transcription elongation factor A protein 3 isoform X2 [Cyprinodon tularosa]|uniref:transcription elongation factor A protein 3 isoform X2 n=1 Tax=Cyprinodon tularosa TaxID=77115 RepID=UPI0018E27A85|nr:transcription elongation factor A protein 3 isoform X2 [Cyprinodon tularosa]